MKKLLYIVIAIIAAGTLSALGKDAKDATARSEIANKAMSDYFFMEGVNQKVLGNSDAAMALFDEALRLNPSALEAYYEKGMIYIEYDMIDSALNIMRTLVEIDSTQQRYNYALALLSAGVQLFEESEKTLLRIIENNPDEELAYAYLIDVYKETGEYEKALHYLDQLIANNGKSSDILHYQAGLHILRNDTAQAINAREEAVALFPYEEDNFVALSSLYEFYEMDSLQKDALLRGLEMHPHSLQLHTLLGKYYVSLDDSENYRRVLDSIISLNIDEMEKNHALESIFKWAYDGNIGSTSVELLRMWLEKEPHNDYARALYIHYLKESNMNEEALSELANWALLSDKQGELWEQLAMEYVSNNMYDQAIEAATQSVNAGNTSFSIYHILALSHSIKEEYDTAQMYAQMSVDNCDRSLFTNEAYSEYENNEIYKEIMSNLIGVQGDIALKQGRIEECYQYYDSALVYYPDNINILNNYAYTIASNDGDLTKAERMSLRVLQFEDNISAYIDTYAWILFKKEQYTLARIYMERAMQLAKDANEDITSYFIHYGDILAMNGEIDLAIEYWERAIEAGSESATLKEKIKLKKYIKE